ncbi:MAG: hypothetical protein Q9159_003295 [Coniocarpon cinnabarinum]
MFKKKPTIKTLSPLRSSDRRKTADRIIESFRLNPSKVSDSAEEPSPDPTSAHSSLRKSLLPDNSLSAKFSTTSGPQLKEVTGVVYVGSHGASEQRVLWIKIGEVLYPSGKMKGGADLMTPGLAGPPFPESAKKGAMVAIASIENPSVPVALGTCVIEVANLRTTQGIKGPAVETFHWAGDELWDWSTSGRPGIAAPAEIPEWLAGSEETIAQATADLTLDEEDETGGVSLPTDDREPEAKPVRNEHLEGEDAPIEGANGHEQASERMSTAEIDDAFLNAFLFGIHQQKQDHRNEEHYGLSFPLSQSLVMSQLVLPFLPALTPEQSNSLQIKKTSWKNARKFILALDKRKLILAKDAKSEAIVRDVDFDDRAFTEFTPYRLPKKEPSTSAGTTGESATSGASGTDTSIGQTLKIETLYKPRDSLAPFFTNATGSKGAYFLPAEIRQCITRYIESNQLVVSTNRRLVTLDPRIANAVLSTSNALDKDVLAKGVIPRDALIDRVIALCNPFYLILHNGETLASTSTKLKGGPPPKVGIIIETRGGNKTATRVHGFEPYSISAQPLADELRKTCAGSTSVEPFKGGKGMEVMVQGPQREAVVKALEKRGVHKGWVETTDKTKKGKK